MENSPLRYSFVRSNPMCQGHAEYMVVDIERAAYVFGTRTCDPHVAERRAASYNRLYGEWLAMRDSVAADLTRRAQGIDP